MSGILLCLRRSLECTFFSGNAKWLTNAAKIAKEDRKFHRFLIILSSIFSRSTTMEQLEVNGDCGIQQSDCFDYTPVNFRMFNFCVLHKKTPNTFRYYTMFCYCGCGSVINTLYFPWKIHYWYYAHKHTPTCTQATTRHSLNWFLFFIFHLHLSRARDSIHLINIFAYVFCRHSDAQKRNNNRFFD